MKWIRLACLVIGAIALTWLIVHIGPDAIWDGLRRIGWGLAVGCGFHLAGLCLDAVTLRWLVTGERPPYLLVVRASIAGHAINAATPGGKLGELTKFDVLEEAVSGPVVERHGLLGRVPDGRHAHPPALAQAADHVEDHPGLARLVEVQPVPGHRLEQVIHR